MCHNETEIRRSEIVFTKESKILVTGASGLLGHALVQYLNENGYSHVKAISSIDVDLLDYQKTIKVFRETYKPEYVFHLAGAVYGIGGNLREPGRIFLENTLINTHVVEACRVAGVKKVVAIGSICAYPSPSISNPIKEEDVFFGEPHPGERAYGQSKRAMLAQLEAYQPSGLDFAFVLSSNLYGPYDHFDLETGHVIPSLIRKFYESSLSGEPVQLWGDGVSRRDIVHSWDAAQALEKIMLNISGRVNLATGVMTSIREVAEILADISGVGNNYHFDVTKPKGHEFPAISIDRLNTCGFKPQFSVKTGLENVYQWYAENETIASKKIGMRNVV